MRRSPFPSSTDLAVLLATLVAAAGAGAGCSDDTCGPGGAPATGLVAAGDQVTLTYGNLSGLAGNDCPDPSAPEGVISRSIEGTQTDGTGLITLCVPRPDLLMSGPRTLGTITSQADVRIVDLQGMASGCTFTLDSSQQPTGTATATGVCADGADPAGFALALDGSVTLRRTCGATVDTVTVTLSGTVAVGSRD